MFDWQLVIRCIKLIRQAYARSKMIRYTKHSQDCGALVQWLWEETHVPKVMSSNPGTIYWMDIFSHTYLL